MHGLLSNVSDGDLKLSCQLPVGENHTRVPELTGGSIRLKFIF